MNVLLTERRRGAFELEVLSTYSNLLLRLREITSREYLKTAASHHSVVRWPSAS